MHFNSKEIILNDGSEFYYTVHPFEMKNILGAVIAVLDEYLFTKKGSSATYKLYRTKDGNWYENERQNQDINSETLLALKLAFHKQEQVI